MHITAMHHSFLSSGKEHNISALFTHCYACHYLLPLKRNEVEGGYAFVSVCLSVIWIIKNITNETVITKLAVNNQHQNILLEFDFEDSSQRTYCTSARALTRMLHTRTYTLVTCHVFK